MIDCSGTDKARPKTTDTASRIDGPRGKCQPSETGTANDSLASSRADARVSVRERPLSEGYYVSAFLSVLDIVQTGSGSILTDPERDWAYRIRNLDEPARRLYVRLIMRQGVTFRLDKLDYPDIDDLLQARRALLEAGLASSAPPATLDGLLAAYTVPEITRLLCVPQGSGTRRRDRVAALLARDALHDRAILARAADWLSPLGHDHFAVHRLCYFGNLRQDLSEFVMRDLGTLRYERYRLDRDAAHFRSRHQLECHLRYYECELLYDTCKWRDPHALASLVASLPPHVAGDVHLERRLDRLRIAIARQFERLGEQHQALALYEGCVRAPARERRVRLLDALQRPDEAAAVARSIVRTSLGDAEREFAERRLAPRGQRPKPFRPATTCLTLRRNSHRVERAALDYYTRSGTCFWLENRLVRGMLGLWIWDILFDAVPGAFFNPFQAAPADFRERSFRTTRAQALDARLNELAAPDATTRLRERTLERYGSSVGIANPLVAWDALVPDILELALSRIPPAHWRAMFDRVLEDPVEHGSGLPDLVRFPDAGGYEFIEIKGPGDALQANQRRWLRHFDAHGIPARVVNVRWAAQRSG